MPCCNCAQCRCDEECFPQDIESLQKWQKDFSNLRKQWSDYTVCGATADSCRCECCCKDRAAPNLVKGRFGLAWVSETPKNKSYTPCGWQLEICDTESRIECQCKKIENWANCPPIDTCPNKYARKTCCLLKKPPCAVKVMPFEASARGECRCGNCKTEAAKTNDKAVATDDCNCNENKTTERSDEQNEKKDSSSKAPAKDAENISVGPVSEKNDDNVAKPLPAPRARSRGRRGRR